MARPTRRSWFASLLAAGIALAPGPAVAGPGAGPGGPLGPVGGLWGGATARDPVTVARGYLAAHARTLGLTAEALATAQVRLVHDLGHGAIVVSFGQVIAGVSVWHDRISVVLTQAREVVTTLGQLNPAATVGRRGDWALTAPDAVAQVLGQLDAGANAGLQGAWAAYDSAAFVELAPDQAGFRRFTIDPADAPGILLGRPARVKPIWFPRGAGLVPAWLVEVRAELAGVRAPVGLAYVIGAADGAVLERHDEVADLRWRVWAETTGDKRPLPSPTVDYMPSPSGVPDHVLPAFVAPSLVTLNGFNTAPNNRFDPWLDGDASQTAGNNVDAYADINEPDGYSNGDLRASANGNGLFDRTYDLMAEPDASTEQLMAAVTQVFYLTNWLHDWYYDSGFNEAAGNAQAYNFGRGGAGADPLHAEADDYSIPDNANMWTPYDGASPTMQLGIYSPSSTRILRLEGDGLGSGAGTTLEVATAPAEFGPRAFAIRAPVVLVRDETAPFTDACDTIRGELAGAVALVDRGKCTFESKARAVAAAGAVAVIIMNNEPGAGANYLPGDNESERATIPALAVSYEDGHVITAALDGGPVMADLTGTLGVRPASAVEGTTSSHEWGHYLHMRLVDCTSYQCAAASEGWGDFVALHMSVHAEDDPSATFGEGVYTAAPSTDQAGYFGVRRYPYSTNPMKNPLTFGDIDGDATFPDDVPVSPLNDAPPNETHNAGEVWAEMMFEAYAGLLADTRGEAPRLSFEEARRRMSDYVVAGMIAAPANPTYVEQRDAILAAAVATDPRDAEVMTAGFARRGAGSCAVAAPRASFDLSGVVESFDVKARLAIVSLDIGDALGVSCDGDGTLDAGESGAVRIVLANASAVPLRDAQLTLSTSTPELTLLNGGVVAVSEVPAFGQVTVVVPVALMAAAGAAGGADVAAPGAPMLVDLAVVVTAPSSCEGQVELATGRWTNVTVVPASAAVETVEEDDALVPWTLTGDPGVWSRGEPTAGAHAFMGSDVDGFADASLESPPLVVATGHPFVMHLSHHYAFEVGEDGPSGSGLTYYDGGVIEVAIDPGGPGDPGELLWVDAAIQANVPYGPAIPENGGNPLAGRAAFTGTNPAAPEADQLTLDFGEGYAGQTVRVRFRIGTDEAAGAPGWVIDDVAFEGIDNLPFPSLTPNVVPTLYIDADGDGIGGQAIASCPAPANAVAVGGDCDDAAATTYPGAPEVCDGVDNDCNDMTDDGAPGVAAWYVDADGDGFGAGAAILACMAPDGAVAAAGDCDDTRADTHPGAAEGKHGGTDRNCDGKVQPEEGCAGGGGAGVAMGLLGALVAVVRVVGRREARGRSGAWGSVV